MAYKISKKYLNVLDKPGKLFLPSNTVEENQEVNMLLERRTEFIRKKRVQKLKDLMVGNLLEGSVLIELTNVCGKFFQFMGFEENRKKYVYPEEALFLAETCNLEIHYKHYPISLQQAYCLLINDTFPLYKYQVYSQLSRQGYKLIKHKVNIKRMQNCLSEKVSTIRKKTAEIAQQSCPLIDLTNENEESSEIICTKNVSKDDKIPLGNDSCANLKSWHKQCNEEKRRILDLVPNMFSKIRLELTSPEQSLLPPNIQLSKKVYEFYNDSYKPSGSVDCLFSRNDVIKINERKSTPSIGNRRKRCNSESSRVLSQNANSDVATEMREYLNSVLSFKPVLQRSDAKKHKKNPISDLKSSTGCHQECTFQSTCYKKVKDYVLSQPDSNIADVSPILSKTDWQSVGHVLQKLQMFEKPSSLNCNDDILDFDMYGVDHSYSKNNPGTPKYRLIILGSDDRLPKWLTLAQIQARLCDNVPILCAINHNGTVNYFEFNMVY